MKIPVFAETVFRHLHSIFSGLFTLQFLNSIFFFFFLVEHLQEGLETQRVGTVQNENVWPHAG